MYETIDVTADAGLLEPMGSKPKFWFEHGELGMCLFKAARPASGEDWSEKLAEQFAQRLEIPHARYELAICRGDHGIVTPRMTAEGQELVHGNETLIELDRDYVRQRAGYGTPLHTVNAVIAALTTIGVPEAWTLPAGATTSADVFSGYLMLDALIGNTDRHHENWAAVRSAAEGDGPGGLGLAPSLDHASSMGRNEPMDRMAQRLGAIVSRNSATRRSRTSRASYRRIGCHPQPRPSWSGCSSSPANSY